VAVGEHPGSRREQLFRVCRAPAPPAGGHRSDQAEQFLLVGHHPEVTDHLGAISDRARQVGQHPARSRTSSRREASALDRAPSASSDRPAPSAKPGLRATRCPGPHQ
jgi:hypothetical protein